MHIKLYTLYNKGVKVEDLSIVLSAGMQRSLCEAKGMVTAYMACTNHQVKEYYNPSPTMEFYYKGEKFLSRKELLEMRCQW